MKILAINGTYRPRGTTTQLTDMALDGAASLGAETEMILLVDRDLSCCKNCLTCYGDLESEVADCVIDDDLPEILSKIKAADGIILSSPVHCGFVSGIMTIFIERICWTLCRPTGTLLDLKGVPDTRMNDKARAFATIVSAGGMPAEMRKLCDLGSPWLQDNAAMFFNGECVGDIYAGASFGKELSDEEWRRAYFHRQLNEEQLKEAFDLGVTMVEKIEAGKIRPFDPRALEKALLTQI